MFRGSPSPTFFREITFHEEFHNRGCIGAGSFSEVFKVASRTDGQIYAVKKSKRQFRSRRDRDRHLQEMRTYEMLCGTNGEHITCPHIIRYFRAWQEEGFFYTQAEYCEGGNLKDILKQLYADEHPVPEQTIWSFVHNIASGLAHIHARSLVHLDIKPHNIFIVAKDGCLKIGDFGMATEVGDSEDGLEGDNCYMAKELLSSSDKQPTADIFSLGVVIYEAITLEVELPSEGEGWHELRDGRIPPLTWSYWRDVGRERSDSRNSTGSIGGGGGQDRSDSRTSIRSDGNIESCSSSSGGGGSSGASELIGKSELLERRASQNRNDALRTPTANIRSLASPSPSPGCGKRTGTPTASGSSSASGTPLMQVDVVRSDKLSKLVKLMLHPDPGMRPTASDILAHPQVLKAANHVLNEGKERFIVGVS
jgi:serine/threonine protein kinase